MLILEVVGAEYDERGMLQRCCVHGGGEKNFFSLFNIFLGPPGEKKFFLSWSMILAVGIYKNNGHFI